MTELFVIIALALLCWGFRVVFVLLIPPAKLPARVRQGLTYLAPAVLAGIATVEITGVVSTADLWGSALAIVAMIIVAVVAYRFRNLTITVAVGLVAILAIDLATYALP